MQTTPEAQIHKTQQLVAALSATVFAMSIAVVVLGWKILGASPEWNAQQILDDPRIKQQVMAELISNNRGVFDTVNDSDVGRVLLPNLDEVDLGGVPISSNLQGMRERNYALPKPDGTVRVVLLGDSFVFGLGSKAEDRLGVFLEQYLRQRSRGFEGKIEVLHVGIGSWNITAQCAYLRRQLSLMQPDLVIHVTVANDLDDMDGVRGSGSRARFSPAARSRADSRVYSAYPRQTMGIGEGNFLQKSLDFESRSRYEEAEASILRLAETIERMEGKYMLVFHWGGLNNVATRFLARGLKSDQIALLSRTFRADTGTWLGESDPHWNVRGNRQVGTFLYGMILSRDLLPQLNLEDWTEATDMARTMHAQGIAEAVPFSVAAWLEHSEVLDSLEPANLTEKHIHQVNGGLDKKGRVSPYSSFLIKSHRDGTLHIQGRALDRREMDGARVRVSLEEVEVGTIELFANQPIDESWPLPAELNGRPIVSVRLESDDYVYVGGDLQHCVVFQLDRIAISKP